MSEQWYYLDQAQQQGPVSLERLLDLAATGRLRPTTLLWKEGIRASKPARSTPELSAAHFAEPATTRASICLGEPLLATLGFLSQASVLVLGLAVFGLLVLFLLR